jgi:hypothetical protein
VAAGLLAACGTSTRPARSKTNVATPVLSVAPVPHAITVHGPGTTWGAAVPGAPVCDPLGGQHCMLPFPSDDYTVADPSTSSGRRVDFPVATMPRNVQGQPIDPAAWNANDGFSPGSTIEVEVPGLDPARSGIVGPYQVATSVAPSAPVVLLDATTGRRLAWWGEIDARDPDHADPLLHHDAGVRTTGLYLAWDFTVISTANLTDPVLHMRDVALADLHGGLPHYQVTAVTDLAQSAHGGRTDTFRLGPNGLPTTAAGDVEQAVFSCLIPRSVDPNPAAASSPVTPGRPVLYGKGLFSVAIQMTVTGVRDLADRYRLVLCSTNWLGLDGNDVLTDAGLLANLSAFPSLPDHLQQAMIDALYLARLEASPHGLAANPAFQSAGPSHRPFIDTAEPLTYDGNSEGSLMGGALTAISPLWRRAVLGVPSMNYSILLPRSVDFAPLYPFLDKSYPNEVTQQLILDVLQMLFDRGETDGYVEQLTTHPLPGTPPHQVLLQMAFGDHQVSNFATEIEARTLDAAVHRPALPAGLVHGNPFARLPTATTAASGASSRAPATLYVWEDPHSPPPPLTDVPPTAGIDPHDFIPRSLPAAQRQLITFLEPGTVPDVCGTGPCTTDVTSAVHLAHPTP